MKTIPLTQGKVAIVDDGDYDWLMRWKWLVNNGYAARASRRDSAGKQRMIYMHREILDPPDGMECDHISGDKLNNRRGNIRFVTRSQNNANRPIPRNNTSGYRGVHWRKDRAKWIVTVKKDGKVYYGGSFDDKEKAGEAAHELRRTLHGEFTRDK